MFLQCEKKHTIFSNIYIFIAIALDEISIYFSMQNIYQSCDLVRALGRPPQPITFFVYWRLHGVDRVSPWR